MSIFAAPNFYNQADQNIYNQGYSFVPQEMYRGGAFSMPTTTDDDPSGITASSTAMNMGGGGSGGSSGNFSTDQLLKNYTLDTRNQYFNNQPTPLVDDLYQSKLDKTFMGFPSYREQELTGPDLGEYIGSGTDVPLEQTTAGKIQSTLGNVKDKASGIMSNIKGFGPISMILGSMDKFDTLSPADQEFIKQNMGYTGPTVFGENTTGGSKDIFGVNTRSAFGNYADFVGEKATSLGDMLSGKMADKYGVEFDPVSGKFVGTNAAYANQMNKMNLAKYSYYTQKEKERVANEELMAKQAAAKSRAESARQYDPAVHGPNNYGLGSDGNQSFDSGQGFGVNATTGGPVSNKTGRGRTDYMDGGLANLVDIYD